MPDPLIEYKSYHKNKINMIIHEFCVPTIIITYYALFPFYLSLFVNIFYVINYLLFDLFSTKSLYCVLFLQILFICGLCLSHICNSYILILVNIVAWIAQIIGHKVFEKNEPAFLSNLYSSFLFGPYLIFLEIFFPLSFKPTKKIEFKFLGGDFNNEILESNLYFETIVYFGGLFDKSSTTRFEQIANELPMYNHVYVQINFKQGDSYSQNLFKVNDVLKDLNIKYIIGYSFGSSIALMYKNMFKKEAKTILIAPGGFYSYNRLEKFVMTISPFLYSIFQNDKWCYLSHFPIYQNPHDLDENDYIIVSSGDCVHYPIDYLSDINNVIKFDNVSHFELLNVVKKQKIISQLLENDFDLENIKTKKLSSFMNRMFFGSHFIPYNVSVWIGIILCNTYNILNNFRPFSVLYGFLLANLTWGLAEYVYHRFLLHNYFSHHHDKHHIFPTKLSIIHLPFSITMINLLIYYLIVESFINENIIKNSFYVFFSINYLIFEWIHLESHFYRGNNNAILNAKQFHKLHHINSKINFSFTTPIFDYLFGTISHEYKITYMELLVGIIPLFSFAIHNRN